MAGDVLQVVEVQGMGALGLEVVGITLREEGIVGILGQAVEGLQAGGNGVQVVVEGLGLEMERQLVLMLRRVHGVGEGGGGGACVVRLR